MTSSTPRVQPFEPARDPTPGPAALSGIDPRRDSTVQSPASAPIAPGLGSSSPPVATPGSSSASRPPRDAAPTRSGSDADASPRVSDIGAPQLGRADAVRVVRFAGAPNVALAEAVNLLRYRVEQVLRRWREAPLTATPTPRLARIEVAFEGADPLSFLAAQAAGGRAFFRSRDGVTTVAMVGVAASFDHPADPRLAALHAAEPSLTSLLVGRFDAEREPGIEWQPFSRTQVIVPAIKLRRDADRTSLVAIIVGDGAATISALDRLQSAEQPSDPQGAVPEYTPGFGAEQGIDSSEDAWNVAIHATLSEIASGSVRKIVLARTRTFRLSEPADPCELLSRLGENEPGTYQFMIEPLPGVAFVGASPERLFRRSGRLLESEAVAGTRPRGETPEADWQQADNLFSSEKDKREHALVLDRIRERLEGAVEQLRVARGARLLRLARVQHLCTPVEASLLADVTDADLLARLHPTPAVCGQPAERARTIIRACEPFDRGLYAGPIGLLGETSEVCVGIRSALVLGSSVVAFAGAGIVAGSDAHAEWRETEHKLATIERLVRPS
jgi:menaquinone-specific isochorismate synthase